MKKRREIDVVMCGEKVAILHNHRIWTTRKGNAGQMGMDQGIFSTRRWNQVDDGDKPSEKGVEQSEGGGVRSNGTVRDSISDACQPTLDHRSRQYGRSTMDLHDAKNNFQLFVEPWPEQNRLVEEILNCCESPHSVNEKCAPGAWNPDSKYHKIPKSDFNPASAMAYVR